MSAPSMKFELPKAADLRETVIARAVSALRRLPPGRAFVLELKEVKPRRSENQNSMLWAMYDQIIELGGEEMQGYTKEELHEFFLGNHFGWNIKTVFGQKRREPMRRSSGLNKQEFSDLVESIVRFMAERGVVLQMPGDEQHQERAA